MPIFPLGNVYFPSYKIRNQRSQFPQDCTYLHEKHESLEYIFNKRQKKIVKYLAVALDDSLVMNIIDHLSDAMEFGDPERVVFFIGLPGCIKFPLS